MSGSDQPLTSQDFCGTAALPLNSDIAERGWHGRKVPEAAIRSRKTAAARQVESTPARENRLFDSIGHKRLRSAQHPSPSSGAWDAASFCFI
jgi:hypothetical protein